MGNHKRLNLLGILFGGPTAVTASRLMGRMADIPVPPAVLSPIIRLYSASTGVESGEYETPADGFTRFNEFFGRTLKPGARSICADPNAWISPCDGRISAFGEVDPSGTEFTIKNSRYTLSSLLGGDADVDRFRNGRYTVIYLHPRDYHRVHVPADAALTGTRHIPGARYPVTAWCENRVENIFDKNERMVFFFDLPNGRPIALVMVAAFGVGNIDTPFDPGCDRRSAAVRERTFDPPVPRVRGDGIGAFLLGSTVVLIESQDATTPNADLETGPVQLGHRLGTVRPKQQNLGR